MQYLLIDYCNPQDHSDLLTLTYKLRDHEVTKKWAGRVSIALKKYQIDDPAKFEGFGSLEDQTNSALININACVDIINNFKPIIDRKLINIADQDTLNYLHHMFEVYHGFLQNQSHEFWLHAPNEVKLALSNLNQLVHTCEKINYASTLEIIQHIVTWYSMPKIGQLEDADYKLKTDQTTFGTVYLNYTEIGKTLEDLAFDNDNYIGDDAFRPHRHLTADFTVKFYTESDSIVKEKRAIIKQYYEDNREFFISRGYPWGHPHITSGSIPLADLVNCPPNLVKLLETRQWVKSVTLI